MNKALPTYELKINEADESFVDAIALVNSPAIESNFIAFSQEQKNITFSADDEKMILVGAIMRPDRPIYRRDETGKEYNVVFSKQTVEQISQVFAKRGFHKNFNIEHSMVPAKSYLWQSYIINEKLGISSPKGLDLTDGDFVGIVKVEDREVWNQVKSGKLQGFSVEGMFQYFNKIELPKTVEERQLEWLINNYNKNEKS